MGEVTASPKLATCIGAKIKETDGCWHASVQFRKRTGLNEDMVDSLATLIASDLICTCYKVDGFKVTFHCEKELTMDELIHSVERWCAVDEKLTGKRGD